MGTPLEGSWAIVNKLASVSTLWPSSLRNWAWLIHLLWPPLVHIWSLHPQCHLWILVGRRSQRVGMTMNVKVDISSFSIAEHWRDHVCLEKFAQILRHEDFQEKGWWALLRWLFIHQLNVLIQGLQGMKRTCNSLGCIDLSNSSVPNSSFATWGYKWPSLCFFLPSLA